MKFEGFIGGSYVAGGISPYVTGNIQAQRSVNLMVEKDESGGGRTALLGRPGLLAFITLALTGIRGMFAWNNSLFAVAAGHLYEIVSSGPSALDRGAIDNDSLPVQIFLNGAQLFVVSGGFGWIYEGGVLDRAWLTNGEGVVSVAGTAVTWTSGDLFDSSYDDVPNRIVINDINYTVATYNSPTSLTLTSTTGVTTSGYAYRSLLGLRASSGAFLNGFFLASEPATGTPSATNGKLVRFSPPRDGRFWDPLDFIVKEAQPDNLVGIFTDHEELYMLGTQTTEVWRATGSQNVFDRDPSGFFEMGCAALASLARLDDSLFMLAGDTRGRVVAVRLRGFQPQRISTPPLEATWQTYQTNGWGISDAIGYSYVENGHQLWVLTFPNANATWVYDVTTGLWHEWAFLNGASLERHKGTFHAYWLGAHYVGDVATARIFRQSFELFSDDGLDIRYIRRTAHINEELQRITYHSFVLDAETGTAASGTPVATLTFSDDDAKTWSNPRNASLGSSGQRGLRLKWNRLGQSRDRIWEVTMTGQAQQVWVAANLEVEKDKN